MGRRTPAIGEAPVGGLVKVDRSGSMVKGEEGGESWDRSIPYNAGGGRGVFYES